VLARVSGRIVLVDAVVGSEAGIGADETRAGHAAGQEKFKDLVIEEVCTGGSVFVKMDSDFLRRSWTEHYFI
jgi:hypothetical protein